MFYFRQSDYREHYSCQTAFIKSIDDWLNAINQNKQQILAHCDHDISICDSKIKVGSVEQLIGVTISNTLCWDAHNDQLIKKNSIDKHSQKKLHIKTNLMYRIINNIYRDYLKKTMPHTSDVSCRDTRSTNCN